jgi:hypothetical protein
VVDVTGILIHWLRVVRRGRSRPVWGGPRDTIRVHRQCAHESRGLSCGARADRWGRLSRPMHDIAFSHNTTETADREPRAKLIGLRPRQANR